MRYLYIHLLDDPGYESGIDAHTPVTFIFSSRPRTKGVNRSFVIENPSEKQTNFVHSNPRVVKTFKQLMEELGAIGPGPMQPDDTNHPFAKKETKKRNARRKARMRRRASLGWDLRSSVSS